MGRSLAVLGCLCALAALAHSAAVPTATQDTLVVAKSEDTSAPTTAVADATTEEPNAPIKLTEMDVRSEVSLRYAHTTIVAKMRNPAKLAQEAHFRVLLPETAFISGFVMTLDGKSYKAYVKEKEEAKQIYQDAVNQGLGAAHISTKARDSNHFTVSVNVEASSSAVFNLTYEELLVRRNGVYNHAINLHPGALVPKLTVTVHVKEAAKISELRVPEIRTGNEIDATKDDAQNSKVAIVRANDDREATITFTPDLQEQELLMNIYKQKSKESAQAASHSYPSWYYSEPKEKDPEGVLGQFVVQYDVERPKDGEILVNDGYFVHFFAPSDLEPLNKHVVFVLDTSGSMMDRKIVQLREAMQTILGELNEGDYFSIVEFSSSVTVHDLKEAENEPPKHHYSYFDYDKQATLVPPSKATKENIARAKTIVSWLQATGGTNIAAALDIAVELINKGVDWVPAAPANSTSVATPVKEEGTTVETPVKPTEASKATEVATPEADKKATKNLEPIIIFLTDGDPTVGETNPKRILTRIQEKNSGDNKATIFSLAFGEDADRKFLRKLSLRHGGFMRHIYEAADAALQLRDFYRQISSPLLAHLKFSYPAAQVKADSVTKHEFRSYYRGSELVVAGRVNEDSVEITPLVGAFCGVDDGYGRKRYEVRPKVPVAAPRGDYLPLERLWSYLTIKQLLDQQETVDKDRTDDKENTPEKKALALALKYEFVTPLTSLVVVKPNATSAIDAESVDKSGGSPYTGLSAHAGFVGGGLSSGYLSSAPLSLSFSKPMAGSFGSVNGASGPLYALHSPLNAGFGMRKPTTSYHNFFLDMKVYEPSTPAPLYSFTHRPLNLLDFVGLNNYSWMETLLKTGDQSKDSINLTVNNTTHVLKLARTDIPKESADMKCDKAVGGGEGVCVYLTRCDAARNITAELYTTTFCEVNQYAGVCCSQKDVDLPH
ncbi:inter-alpha-trypsin inhibitor heavy chain H4-like isoform X3 [Trichoplusia ni]|uniref:Inter-alpha-trypsin inhibitor heavy chain H4-like isoform X3 n=1 Tax=Trichoplusia ni TaxID=7111 RepID=A0A7E5VD83_TRINI|nr:inter-alpha-trypsin inhibitor heavy chain H4-like isoform X3 [Trichoplusia ni]